MTYHRYAHFEARNFACDQCTQRFKSPHILRTHKNTVHSTVFRYECETCGRKFKRDHHLVVSEKLSRFGDTFIEIWAIMMTPILFMYFRHTDEHTTKYRANEIHGKRRPKKRQQHPEHFKWLRSNKRKNLTLPTKMKHMKPSSSTTNLFTSNKHKLIEIVHVKMEKF